MKSETQPNQAEERRELSERDCVLSDEGSLIDRI